MSDQSRIEWCDSTINVVYGCTPVSPGCAHCYAARMAGRLGALTRGTHAGGRWTGKLNIFPERMLQACRWRKPRRIFVNSMGDLFHPDVPDEALDRVFAVMALCPQHTFQVLTKRPERMLEYMTSMYKGERYISREAHIIQTGDNGPAPHIELVDLRRPLPNVWLGVTAEDQKRADERIPVLLNTPAAKRFVSVEPMLGAVDLWAVKDGSWYDREGATRYNALTGTAWWGSDGSHGLGGGPRLDWIICGGETGPGARPMHPDWARSLRDQCVGVPFYFKSWGNWAETEGGTVDGVFLGDRFLPGFGTIDPEKGVNMSRVGRRRAGRLLDGRTWDEFPEAS